MSRYKKKKLSDSPETIATAKKLAQQVKNPAQNKTQVKLLEQGIKKGITLYKKQQKEKQRKANKLQKQQQKHKQEIPEMSVKSKCSKLPWILLFLTWIGIGAAITIILPYIN